MLVASSLNVWMEGNQVVVHAEWRVPDATGILTDPTTVVYTARRADDSPTAYTYGVATQVTRVSAGIFELRIVPASGVWRVHVQGTGAAYAAEEISFKIDKSGALA